MEDLITLVIAIAIGLASLIAGQKNKNKKTAPRRDSDDADSIPTDVLERELSGVPESTSQTKQPSALDILGRILSGDLSDLMGQPKPEPQVVEREYSDPLAARRRRQAEQEAERKRKLELEELNLKSKPVELSATATSLRNPEALRQAIVVNEILNKPVSLRRQRRAG